jgi:hypothetical protein
VLLLLLVLLQLLLLFADGRKGAPHNTDHLPGCVAQVIRLVHAHLGDCVL